MRITLAICTWNRCTLLEQTLGFLSGVTVPTGVEWQVLVINNNCTDATDEIVGRFNSRLPLRLVHEPVPGLANARNRSLDEAIGDYVVWIDDDVALKEDFLTRFVEGARGYPDAAVFGGPVDPWFPVAPNPALLEAFPALRRGFCGIHHNLPLGPLSADRQVIGANMALRLASLNGLRVDPRLGRAPGTLVGGEESDLLGRIRAAGGAVVWLPDMRVQHYVSPERMTLAYLLEYSAGGGEQHILTNGVPAGRKIWGVPRWMVREWIMATLRYLVCQAAGNRRGALVALERRFRIAGMIRGCRVVAKRPRPAGADIQAAPRATNAP